MTTDRVQRTVFGPAVLWVVAIGIALSIAQQYAIPDEVFVSGDGGIKTLIAKQFARGEWHTDLRLPAEPWVRELWQDGLYPFGPPFAYDRDGHWFIQYPLPFMVVTAPFYDLFGFRGLTLIPLLGLWLLWFSMAGLLRRFEVSQAGSAIAMGGLIFCSFVTPYGALYWEHTLALGLSFFGFSLLMGRDAEPVAPATLFAGGFLLGLSVWFRPEGAAFAAGVFLGLLGLQPNPRTWLGAWLGFALICLIFAASNYWFFDSPFGVHAIQEVDPATAHVAHAPFYSNAWYFIGKLFRYCPVFAVVIAISVAGFRYPTLRPGRLAAMLWLIVFVSTLGTALVVPNDGGTQLGARYFLHTLPPLFILLGISWDRSASLRFLPRRVLQAAVAAGLILGVYLNAIQGTQAIFRDYQYRALPALQAIREDPHEVVVVEHQWMAQDLEAAFDQKVFFRIRNQTELMQLGRAMLEHDRPQFTLVRYNEMKDIVIEETGLRLHMRERGRFGSYVLVDCEVDRG